MENVNINAIEKIIGMFRPCDRDFLDLKKEETICGPNDRAVYGYDNYFPKKWLIEDFKFTDSEANWFIEQVNNRNALEGDNNYGN